MNKKISEQFRSFVFDESLENGIADQITNTNAKVAKESIEYRVLLDDRLGEPYFYECMKLALGVIESFEVEELEE